MQDKHCKYFETFAVCRCLNSETRLLCMRVAFSLRMFAWLALGLTLAVSRLEAQTITYGIGAAPNPVGVSNNVIYTLLVTNQFGVSLSITVTNTLSGTSFQFVGVPTYSQGAASTTSNQVIFSLGQMSNNAVAQMGWTVQPTSAGSLNDFQSVATNGVFFGTASNYVVQVTNPAVVADLAVAITGPASQVFSNDWLVYSVNVTNLGPNSAPNVLLTNTLPPGVGYKSVSPAFTRIGSGSNVTFN